MVLLLRHSRLRIGDAVTLERTRVADDKLFLDTAKTGTPVCVPLPPFVLTALEADPKVSEQYFFGQENPKLIAQREIGSGRLKGFSRKQESPMDTPTPSTTPLPPNS